jgi:putative membrane protein
MTLPDEPQNPASQRCVPGWMLEGDMPDYRFSLANERTFLAWIRTALALVAGAVAVVQVVPNFTPSGARTVLGAVLSLMGLCLAPIAYLRWARNERAMRLRRELPYPRTVQILAVVVAGIAAVVLLLALFASS